MPESWDWLRARLTPRRRLALLFGLCSIVVALAVLLIGVVVDQARIAAVIALVILAADATAAAVATTWALRRVRLVRGGLEGEPVEVTAPSRATLNGSLRTPAADSIRAGLLRAAAPAHMIAAFGMSSRSPDARDQLAGMATGWRFDWSSLAEVVRGGGDATEQLAALGPTDPAHLVLLARMIASQRLHRDDDLVAGGLLKLVAHHPARERLSLSARRMLIERLAADGDRQTVLTLLGAEGGTSLADRFVVWDLLNPFHSPSQPTEAWLASVNGMYRRAGLETILLEPEGPTPFDRLRSSASSHQTADSPVVTVVMTSFQPEREALRTAVLSILAQSWTAWELIVADDGSSAEFEATLDEIAALDGRITVLRSTTNDGTYVRRNDAIQRARGDLVTFLDSDDWAHPRRLELQVRHLVRHPAEPANLTRSARLTSELTFLQPRGSMLRLTEASLMFRREQVLSKIGWFDTVRKAADTGYRLRIEAAFGRPIPVVQVEAPLTLVRYQAGSLSGGDLRDGWTHPARVAYSSALARWIETERAAGRAPFLAQSPERRPFPVLPHLVDEKPRPIDLDVLFVVDVRAQRGRDAAEVDREIADAAGSGLRVGVRRAEKLRSTWVSPNARADLQDAINAGRLVEVIPQDAVSARLVVVPDGSALIGVGEEAPIHADRLVLVRHPAVDDAVAEQGARRLAGDQPVEFTDAAGARAARQALTAQ